MTAQSIHPAPIDGENVNHILSEFFISGGTFSAVFSEGSANEDETMYSVGYSLYEQGRYSEAFKIFSVLVMRNHLEHRYVSGLGGACQMLGRYQDALQHYMTAATLNMDDPKPIFHAAECLVALSHIEEAKSSLQLVLEICPDIQNPLNGRAQALLQRL